jgi:hypothetical protein
MEIFKLRDHFENQHKKTHLINVLTEIETLDYEI